MVGQASFADPPGGVAIGLGRVWATDPAGDALREIDPTTSRAAGSPIQIGSSPTGVAISGGRVWVVDGGERRVAEYDPRSGKIIRSVAVGNGAGPIVAVTDGVWVVNSADGTAQRIAAGSGQVLRSDPGRIGAVGDRGWTGCGVGDRRGRRLAGAHRPADAAGDPARGGPDAGVGGRRRRGCMGRQHDRQHRHAGPAAEPPDREDPRHRTHHDRLRRRHRVGGEPADLDAHQDRPFDRHRRRHGAHRRTYELTRHRRRPAVGDHVIRPVEPPRRHPANRPEPGARFDRPGRQLLRSGLAGHRQYQRRPGRISPGRRRRRGSCRARPRNRHTGAH